MREWDHLSVTILQIVCCYWYWDYYSTQWNQRYLRTYQLKSALLWRHHTVIVNVPSSRVLTLWMFTWKPDASPSYNSHFWPHTIMYKNEKCANVNQGLPPQKNWGTLCSYPLCFWSYIKGLIGPQHPNEIVSERVCPLMRLLKSFNLALWCHWINTGKAEDWMLLIRIREIIRSPFDACHSVILIHTSIFEHSIQIPVIWLLLWKNTCSILCHYLKTY